MKQWKNGEKFSSSDYNSERAELVQQITNADLDLDKKSRFKFLLSEKTPKEAYAGTIWIDPQTHLFLFKNIETEPIDYSSDTETKGFLKKSSTVAELRVSYSSEIVAALFEIEARGLQDISLSYESQSTGYIKPFLESAFTDNINYDSGIFGYITPFLESTFTDSINYDSGIFGFVTPFLESAFTENIDYVSVVTSNAALDVDRLFLENINYTSEMFVYKQPQFKSEFDLSVGYESSTTSTPKQLIERIFSENISYESSTTSTPRQLLSRFFSENISYQSSTTSTPRQLLERIFSESISYNSETSSTPRQFLARTFSENINYESLTKATPYLKFSRTFSENINYESSFIAVVSTTYQVKAYTTVGPVDITVNFSDENIFSITLQTFEQLLGIKSPNTDVTVTAPSSFLLNDVSYSFVDWRVDETGQSSSNRIFTTTIDQPKTLRVRYIGFAFNP